MPLIVNRQLTDDPWVLIQPNEHQSLQQVILGRERVIVPYCFLEEALQLSQDAKYPQILGAQINGDDDISHLASTISRLSLISIEFPVFRDGRGFSIALQVHRLGFKKELRAVGRFGRDQLGYLKRCGFTAFELADDNFDIAMLSAFDEISVHYQGAVDGSAPIYRQKLPVT